MKYIDMHCDTIREVWKSRLRGDKDSLRENNHMIDLLRMKDGDCLCQNLGIFINLHEPLHYSGRDDTEEGRREAEQGLFMDPWEQEQAIAQVFLDEVSKNSDLVGLARSGSEIRKNLSDGKMSVMMTIEDGGCCKGSIEHLHTMYEQGARMMTLTWNFENELGYPNYPDGDHYFEFPHYRCASASDSGCGEGAEQGGLVPEAGTWYGDGTKGLKQRGFEFLEEMQRIGMIVDVAHLSDAGFYDVCRTVKGPFVASHSNARSLCGCGRDLTDDMLRKIAEHGGVTGLNMEAEFLVPDHHAKRTAEAVARHARHIADAAGVDVLGFGTDFDGISCCDGDEFGEPGARTEELLIDAFRKQGFSMDEIEKIFYKNVLRVYDEILG